MSDLIEPACVTRGNTTRISFMSADAACLRMSRPLRSKNLHETASGSVFESIRRGAVAELVGIEVGVVSGVINLESSGVEASDWRLRHEATYHEA